MRLIQLNTVPCAVLLVSLVLCTPQSRPPRPPRPDELAGSPQSSGVKKRPPPPPTSGSGLKVDSGLVQSFEDGGPVQSFDYGGLVQSFVSGPGPSTKWIWDENCKSDRPPFDLGRWIQVQYDECPIAFDDPNFDDHQNFCGDKSTNAIAQLYGSKMEGMWTYPEYKYCESVPVCLACPALGRCGPSGGSSSGLGSCTCNGWINPRGEGECGNRYNGRYFCYVDSSANCEKFKSMFGTRYYSFEACQI